MCDDDCDCECEDDELEDECDEDCEGCDLCIDEDDIYLPNGSRAFRFD